MTDLDRAIAASREALAPYASVNDYMNKPLGALRDLLAALDAARGDVRQKVEDTLTDYLDHYPHPEFLDAVMAHFTPPAVPRIERYAEDDVIVHWPDGEVQYTRVGNCVTDAPPAALAVPADFTEWLAREMPAGTVIGDPQWWANMIARRFAQFAAKENTNG